MSEWWASAQRRGTGLHRVPERWRRLKAADARRAEGPPAVMPSPPAGILASVCGALVMLLPETRGIALPETVDDVEKLGRYCMRQINKI